jgi:hypothetical protein
MLRRFVVAPAFQHPQPTWQRHGSSGPGSSGKTAQQPRSSGYRNGRSTH